ncbi:hypothetical protein AVEN_258646-1 [Araneus ventricosus]|uniref:Uncharacterized protein n=1 Tax=Araneus ventricosus TaxID=182803 RepID=A0A4Y2JKC6_ARAVE|nr:hypothetical protein AVEN_258646-1 [Araneus ventricosus]
MDSSNTPLQNPSPAAGFPGWGSISTDQLDSPSENVTTDPVFSCSSCRILSGKDDSKSVIWKIPVPSSTKYCRHIKFIFAKESTDLITTEVEEIKHQIKELEPTKIFFGDLEISVTPTLIFCIVDRKVCNAVSSCASTQTCYLCGAKPNEMNKLRVIPKKEVSKEFLTFGISPLHPWIRLLEGTLHISYRLKIKTCKFTGSSKKREMDREMKKLLELYLSDKEDSVIVSEDSSEESSSSE